MPVLRLYNIFTQTAANNTNREYVTTIKTLVNSVSEMIELKRQNMFVKQIN